MAQTTHHDPDHRVETQPLLPEAPIIPPSDIPKDVDGGNKAEKSPTAISRIFLKISFLLLGDYIASADDMFLLAVYDKVASEFDSSDRAAWLMLVESLMCIIFLPLYGYLADRYGGKKPVLISYAFFLGGVLTTSFAPNFEVLVLGRTLAGIAIAGMLSLTTIIIAENARPSDVGVLRSYAMVFSLLGRNTGPLIGGYLTDSIGWRKAFLCEIPIIVICFAMVMIFFDADKPEKETEDQATPKPDKKSGGSSVDLGGIILLSIVSTAFTVAMSYLDNEENRTSPVMIASASIFVVTAIALFFWERHMGDKTFVPLSIFKSRMGLLFLAQPLNMVGYFSLYLILPKYFTRVDNVKSSLTAAHLIPISVSSVLGNLIAGRITKITRRYKILMCIGAAIAVLGFFLISFTWRGHIGLGRSFIVAVVGLGTGTLNATAFVALNQESEENKKGALIGFFYLAQELGILVGIAGSSSLVQSIYESGLYAYAPNVANRATIISKIIKDSSFAYTLPQIWQDVSSSSFLKAFQIFTLTGGCISILVQPLLWAIKERRLD